MSDSSWLKEYYAEQKERREALPARAKALAEKLKALGLTQVVAEYSGSGDSGQIDGISWEPSAVKIDKAEEEIQNFFYDVLEARYAGWENNDGASGNFVWDLTKENGLHHEHLYYYTESDRSEHEGF